MRSRDKPNRRSPAGRGSLAERGEGTRLAAFGIWMLLRCKVLRAVDAHELEEAINRFLAAELEEPWEIQFEEITQSEGPGGVTVTIWYSVQEAERPEAGEPGPARPEELA